MLAPPCQACATAQFTPGSEFFDPMVLPHLKKFDAVERIAWRIHYHDETSDTAFGLKYYFAEILMELNSPFYGVMSIDGPPNVDPKLAIEDALAEAVALLELES